MRIFVMLIGCALLGCGSSTVSPEDETLSQIMALTNVSRQPIQSGADGITGVRISVDVVNVGVVSVNVPFVMTWRLRGGNGETVATATHRFSQMPFEPSERRPVNLVLTFAARANLDGVRDGVSFAFE